MGAELGCGAWPTLGDSMRDDHAQFFGEHGFGFLELADLMKQGFGFRAVFEFLDFGAVQLQDFFVEEPMESLFEFAT